MTRLAAMAVVVIVTLSALVMANASSTPEPPSYVCLIAGSTHGYFVGPGQRCDDGSRPVVTP